jgi:hypothetical protein
VICGICPPVIFSLTENPYSDKMDIAKIPKAYSYPENGSVHEKYRRREKP